MYPDVKSFTNVGNTHRKGVARHSDGLIGADARHYLTSDGLLQCRKSLKRIVDIFLQMSRKCALPTPSACSDGLYLHVHARTHRSHCSNRLHVPQKDFVAISSPSTNLCANSARKKNEKIKNKSASASNQTAGNPTGPRWDGGPAEGLIELEVSSLGGSGLCHQQWCTQRTGWAVT